MARRDNRLTLTSVRISRRAYVSFCCAIVSSILHAFLVAPIFLRADADKRASADDWVASAAVADDGLRTYAMILIVLPEALSITDAAPVNSNSDHALQDFPIHVATSVPDPPKGSFGPDDQETEADMPVELNVSDAAALALRAGRYTGLVSARIERAWTRPRTPIVGGKFQCQVRIEQDRAGGIAEVELMACNGDSRWQESLVFAIEGAAPFSAPPDTSLFTNQLMLTFSAFEYRQASPGIVKASKIHGRTTPVIGFRTRTGFARKGYRGSRLTRMRLARGALTRIATVTS